MFRLLLISLFIFTACKSYKAPQLAAHRIELTEGGGFTGAYKSWYLLDNGQVFLKDQKDTAYHAVKKISKKTAVKYYKQAEKIFQTDRIIPRNPMNFSRSLSFYNAENATTAIWAPGDGKFAELDSFFTQVLGSIEKANP